MVRCADESLYTGYTNDIHKRIEAHNISEKGAKYTRSKRPVTLVYTEIHDSKKDAMKREAEIKRLPRKEKLLLITKLK